LSSGLNQAYIFGLTGNDVLRALVEPAADDVRVRRAEGEAPVVRRYAETRYGTKSWRCHRRVAARIEANAQGLDIRFVVTNLQGGSAEWLYDTVYCAQNGCARSSRRRWSGICRRTSWRC
jgi:hypothetical protein